MNAQEKNLELTDSIIEVAAKHFAEKGFSGARVDEIAADVGVNKATMYYRIGNKQALYEAVFIEPMESALELVTRAVAEAPDPESQLAVYIRALAANVTDKYTYFPALMMRELVSGAERIPEQVMRTMCEVQGILRNIIELGMERGVFREVNPFLVHMLIMGSLTVYTTGEPMRQRMTAMFTEFNLPQEHINSHECVLEEIIGMITHSVLKG